MHCNPICFDALCKIKIITFALNKPTVIMSDVKGKVVWVTGASAGIGEALAIVLAGRGARLVLSARRLDKLQEVQRKLPASTESLIVPLDLTDMDSFPAKVDEVMGRFGRIDVLFNNGGISQRGLALETPVEVDRQILEIDYLGTVALTKAVLPHLLAQKTSHIGVTSSLVGYIESPYRTSYSAAKHALHGFFDSLRAELHDRGLRVTLFCPGFIKTDISVNALTESGEKLNEMDPAQARGMEPMECAEQMVRAVERNKNEVYIGGKEVIAVYYKRFLPKAFSRFIRKAAVRG
jgi:short-subunit dehydrogenase